ncbi:MAG: hypothetical protein IJY04_00875 [Clostridia bacterium]|nr:hypothetical protein [Clostridia bacterium]
MKFSLSRHDLSAFSVILRRFTALIALISILSSSSCAPRSTDPELFFFRSSDIYAELLVECNDNLTTLAYKRTGATEETRILSPSPISDICFTKENGVTRISAGNVSAEAPTALTLLPSICSAIFSPTPETVSSITTEKVGETTLTVTRFEYFSISLSPDGLPVSAEGVINGVAFNAEITAFTVENSGS